MKALQEDFVNRPFFDEIIDYRTKTNQIWWRGYSPYDDPYRYNVSNLLEALILFDGDERFDDHVNCLADIFNATQESIVADFQRAKGLYSGETKFIERRGCLGNETETIDPDVVFEDALMPKIFGQKIFKQGSNAYHWYDEKSQNGSFPFMVLGNDFHFRTFTLNTELMCSKVSCLIASFDQNQLCKPTVDNTGKRFDKNSKLPIIFTLKSYEPYLSVLVKLCGSAHKRYLYNDYICHFSQGSVKDHVFPIPGVAPGYGSHASSARLRKT